MICSDHQSEAPPLPPYPFNDDKISMPPIGHIEEKLGNALATLRQVDTVIRHLPRADWHLEACLRIHEMGELTHDALGDKAIVARRMWIPPSPPPDLQTHLHTASSSGAQGVSSETPFQRRSVLGLIVANAFDREQEIEFVITKHLEVLSKPDGVVLAESDSRSER